MQPTQRTWERIPSLASSSHEGRLSAAFSPKPVSARSSSSPLPLLIFLLLSTKRRRVLPPRRLPAFTLQEADLYRISGVAFNASATRQGAVFFSEEGMRRLSLVGPIGSLRLIPNNKRLLEEVAYDKPSSVPTPHTRRCYSK